MEASAKRITDFPGILASLLGAAIGGAFCPITDFLWEHVFSEPPPKWTESTLPNILGAMIIIAIIVGAGSLRARRVRMAVDAPTRSKYSSKYYFRRENAFLASIQGFVWVVAGSVSVIGSDQPVLNSALDFLVQISVLAVVLLVFFIKPKIAMCAALLISMPLIMKAYYGARLYAATYELADQTNHVIDEINKFSARADESIGSFNEVIDMVSGEVALIGRKKTNNSIKANELIDKINELIVHINTTNELTDAVNNVIVKYETAPRDLQTIMNPFKELAERVREADADMKELVGKISAVVGVIKQMQTNEINDKVDESDRINGASKRLAQVHLRKFEYFPQQQRYSSFDYEILVAIIIALMQIFLNISYVGYLISSRGMASAKA